MVFIFIEKGKLYVVENDETLNESNLKLIKQTKTSNKHRCKTVILESTKNHLQDSVYNSKNTFERYIPKIKAISRDRFKVINDQKKSDGFQSIHILNMNQNINLQIKLTNSEWHNSVRGEDNKMNDSQHWSRASLHKE